jgi:hypothetical protein
VSALSLVFTLVTYTDCAGYDSWKSMIDTASTLSQLPSCHNAPCAAYTQCMPVSVERSSDMGLECVVNKSLQTLLEDEAE